MRTFGRVITVIGASILVLLSSVVGLFALARIGNRPAIRALTRIQRDVMNPGALREAGEAGSFFGVVEHVGRRSGKHYETPVTPQKDGDDWLIGLVFGKETSWARNVAAAGSAHLRMDGVRHPVEGIEILPVDSTRLAQIAPGATRLFNIQYVLRMRPAAV